jgi:hypothetical protein
MSLAIDLLEVRLAEEKYQVQCSETREKELKEHLDLQVGVTASLQRRVKELEKAIKRLRA